MLVVLRFQVLTSLGLGLYAFALGFPICEMSHTGLHCREQEVSEAEQMRG